LTISMGLLLQGSPETTHAAQNRQRLPHFSEETICCPALIPGDSDDSEYNPSSDARAKRAFFRRYPNDFGRTTRWHPGFAFRADYGRFLKSRLFSGWVPFLSSEIGPEAIGRFGFGEKTGLLDDYVVDVEVSLHEQACLVNSSAVLSYSDRLVLWVDLDYDDFLVGPFCYSDLLDPRWR